MSKSKQSFAWETFYRIFVLLVGVVCFFYSFFFDVKAYLESAVPYEGAVPGASIAVQTYGDFLNFNPHLHVIVSNGCFQDNDDFHMAPGFFLEDLEKIFQHKRL